MSAMLGQHEKIHCKKQSILKVVKKKRDEIFIEHIV